MPAHWTLTTFGAPGLVVAAPVVIWIASLAGLVPAASVFVTVM
ncbi:MAG TPA: hypothetical protein VIK08_09440 [Candidatus Limnocylindrales bacterium]